MQIHEDVADLRAGRGVAHAEPDDVRMPGRGVRNPLEGEPEHLGTQAEEAVEDRLEGQVLLELVGIHREVAAAEAGVAVAPVPGPQGRLLAVLAQDLLEASDLVGHAQAQRGDEAVIEAAHRLRVARHLHLDGVVGPRRVPQERGNPPPDLERLGQERLVRVARLVELAMLELPAQVAPPRLLHERVGVGRIQGDPVRAGRSTRPETGDEVVVEPVELVTRQVEAVLELVDVPLEGGRQLHEAPLEGAYLRAGPGVQAVPGSTQVAHEAVKQAARLTVEARRLRARGEGEDRRREVLAEREVHPPAVEPLLGLLAGIPDGRVDVDPGHEGAGRVAGGDARIRLVERQQDGREGAPPAGRDGGHDERFGLGEGLVRGDSDLVRRRGEVHGRVSTVGLAFPRAVSRAERAAKDERQSATRVRRRGCRIGDTTGRRSVRIGHVKAAALRLPCV